MSHCPPHVSKFLTVSKDLEGMLRVVYPKAISQSRSHLNPLVFGVKMCVCVMGACRYGFPLAEVTSVLEKQTAASL